MAEAVVSFAVENIGKLLVQEAKFLWGVEGKVEDLQEELKLIQCLLRDADARREQNHTVRECVAQLRDIAYDAEDVIERYILTIALKKGQNIIKAYACFVVKCTCVQIHVVGTKIDGLKSRISDIGRRMQRYGIQPVEEGERKQATTLMPNRAYDHFEEDFVGREDSIEELVKTLLSDMKKHRVIFIWGMGGLGKTSLAKKVIVRDEVKNSFDSFAWICVSQEYNIKDILVGILVKLIPDQREEVKGMIDDELYKKVYQIQQQKRCLVVLDDIWTKEAWDSLQAAFPVKDTKSKLLITTRNKEVAEHIDPKGFFHELQCLSDHESWDLLKKRAFPERKVELPHVGLRVDQGITAAQPIEGISRQAEMDEQIPVITEDMKRLGYELLKRCKGLPLAIIVLGGLLAANEWETIYQKINLLWGDMSDVSKVLALSYDDLPCHLKPCFLYLGMYPEDAEIPAREVLHMWIAEGFVWLNAYDEDKEVQVEDKAEGYLKELFKRGMIQVRFTLSGKIKTCHLHDLMRDLCISKARQESFLSIRKIQQDNEIEDFPSPMAIKVEATGKVRRLSLNVRVSDGEQIFPSLKPIEGTTPHLRALMLFQSVEGKWKQFPFDFINCKSLRVLKLENLSLFWRSTVLPESVGDLIQLRFLSLAGSGYLDLPRSMGNLVCMEFLDLDGVRNMSMPNVLWKMKRLRHLRLPTFYVLWKHAKYRLDTLKNLLALENISPYICDVNHVKELLNLRKLSVSMEDKLDIIPQLAKLSLERLQSSTFRLVGSFTECELSKTSSYCHSCKISILGKIEKLSEHRSLPQRLRKLVLIRSHLKEDPMPILEKLEHLVILVLGENAFEGWEMVCSAGGFPQLTHLLLFGLFRLRVAEGGMPRLSRLGIDELAWMETSLPRGVPTYDCKEDYWKERRKAGHGGGFRGLGSPDVRQLISSHPLPPFCPLPHYGQLDHPTSQNRSALAPAVRREKKAGFGELAGWDWAHQDN